METIYADFEWNTDDMFVITPEGNRFTFFSADGFNEDHDDVIVVDPTSHKSYTVVFNE